MRPGLVSGPFVAVMLGVLAYVGPPAAASFAVAIAVFAGFMLGRFHEADVQWEERNNLEKSQ